MKTNQTASASVRRKSSRTADHPKVADLKGKLIFAGGGCRRADACDQCGRCCLTQGKSRVV